MLFSYKMNLDSNGDNNVSSKNRWTVSSKQMVC